MKSSVSGKKVKRRFLAFGKSSLALVLSCALMCVLIGTTFTFTLSTAYGTTTAKSPKDAEFTSDYSSRAELREAALDKNEEIVEEGAVLIKNEGALPLAEDAKVTIFGKNSVNLVYQGSGSSGNAGAHTKTIYDAFAATEMQANPYMKAFYADATLSGSGRPGLPTFGNIPSGMPVGETRATGALDYGGTAYDLREPDNDNASYDPATTKSNYNVDVKLNPSDRRGVNLRKSYTSYNDAAIVVFSRIGGEGYDLPRKMVMNPTVASNQYPATNGNGNYANRPQNLADDAALMIPGARARDSHYMQLDLNEINVLKEAAAKFDDVIVVINSASPIELDFLDDTEKYPFADKIKGCLWLATPGENGIMALPRLLNGDVNPSGRLVDTYHRDFLADKTMLNFSNNNIANGNRYSVDGKDQSIYFVDYQEDIYMGYRYYETKYAEVLAESGKEAADAWYAEAVCRPFGYGLSYTTFKTEVAGWRLDGAAKTDGSTVTITGKSNFEIDVKVTNNGESAGKKAVQIYAEAPYTPGGIEKAAKILVGYDKTKTLAPGQSETITITCPAYYFASWDGTDANANDFVGYEIEAGDYKLYAADNAHDSSLAIPFKVGTDLKITEDPSTGAEITPLFQNMTDYMNTEYSPTTPGSARLSRDGNFANEDTLSVGSSRKATTAENIATYGISYTFTADTAADSFAKALAYTGAQKIDKAYALTHPAQSLTYDQTKIKFADMYGVDYEDEKWDKFMSQLTWQEMADLIAGGSPNRFSSRAMDNIGKPAIIHNDGPLGWSTKTNQGEMAYNSSDTEFRQRYWFSTTAETAPIALASTCLVAASMSRDFQLSVGEILGEDGLWGFDNIDATTNSGGYAPGANIHRTPFSGRNFEYFSEDGVLSGTTAGEIMVGEQNKGVFSFIKHFFLNDQETNRDTNSLATWVTEQAMREIYARSFEIGIKMAIANNPKLIGLMTAFNRLGNVYAGANYNALTGLLRGEWGFQGDVITDWTGGGYMQTELLVLAGNNKQLGTKALNVNDYMLNEPTYGNTYKWSIMKSAKDILFTDVNSNAIVHTKAVRTMPIDLTQDKYNKDGSSTSFKIGEPVYFDLRGDVNQKLLPTVLYGDKTKVKYDYRIADGYALPAGLTITADGIIKGTPQATTDGTLEVHFYVGAKGVNTSEGKAGDEIVYNAGIQVVKINVEDDITYKPVTEFKFDRSGLIGAVKAGAVDLSLTASGGVDEDGVDYTVIYLPDPSMPLPAGFSLSEDGKLTGSVAEGTEAYTHVFTVGAYKFAGGKLVERTSSLFCLQLGETSADVGETELKVGENGNLWLNGVDTGIKAPTAPAENKLTVGENGNLWLNGVDTGIKAPKDEEKTGGCGSAVGLGLIVPAAVTLLAAAVIIFKRREKKK